MYSVRNLIICCIVCIFPLSACASEVYNPPRDTRETREYRPPNEVNRVQKIQDEKAGYLKIKPLSQMKDGVMGITNNVGISKGQYFSQEVFDKAWKYSGLKWVRVAPVGLTDTPGVYDWERADGFYGKLLDNGWKPFILLHPVTDSFRPPCENIQFKGEGSRRGGKNLVIYVDESTPLKRGCNEKDRAIAIKRWLEFTDFITAFSKRYRGKITHYELWNEASPREFRIEMNISKESFTAQYGKSARSLSKAIKRGNPDAKVMVGALVAASLHPSNPDDIHGHLNVFRKALSVLGPDNYDIFSWHPYRLCDVCRKPTAQRPEAGVSYGDDLKYFPWKTFEEETREVVKVATMDGRKPDVEIWDTESGFVYYDNCNTGGPYSSQFFNQAKWFTRHFAMLFGTNPYVKKWFIFSGRVEPTVHTECPFSPRSLINEGNPPYKRMAYYTASYLGSIFETDNLAPAGQKIQFRNTSAPGFREKPRAISLKKDGKDVFIGYWIPEIMDDKFKTQGRTDLVVDKVYSKPVLIYLVDNPETPPGHPGSKWGAVVPITDFKASGNSTSFTNLPVTDYLYFIAEESAVNIGGK